MAIQTTEQAKQAISADAAKRASAYLEREAPSTMEAIAHLVNEAAWTQDEILEFFQETYGLTEEKTRHKIGLVVEALVRQRES
jgi:hypothetical protein